MSSFELLLITKSKWDQLKFCLKNHFEKKKNMKKNFETKNIMKTLR